MSRITSTAAPTSNQQSVHPVVAYPPSSSSLTVTSSAVPSSGQHTMTTGGAEVRVISHVTPQEMKDLESEAKKLEEDIEMLQRGEEKESSYDSDVEIVGTTVTPVQQAPKVKRIPPGPIIKPSTAVKSVKTDTITKHFASTAASASKPAPAASSASSSKPSASSSSSEKATPASSSSSSSSSKPKLHASVSTTSATLPSDTPATGEPSQAMTTNQLRYVAGWDYEGYYTRWSEALGVDILISCLLLAVGAWFHADSAIMGQGTLTEALSRLVEDSLFWKLNSSEGDRLNLGVDDIQHRWKEAIRRARNKLTPAMQKRIHTLAYTHGRGSSGVCMQIYRGPPPETLVSVSAASIAPHSSLGAAAKSQRQYMRFVPYPGDKCQCMNVQHAPIEQSSSSLSLDANSAPALSERVQSLYAPFYDTLKEKHLSGAFISLQSIAGDVAKVEKHQSVLDDLIPLLPKLIQDFELQPANSKQDLAPSRIFFQSLPSNLSAASLSALSTVTQVALIFEYLMHSPRFHAWLLCQHDVRIEMALDGADNTELQVAWLTNTELYRRCQVRNIQASFDDKDKIAAAISTGYVLPSEVAKEKEEKKEQKQKEEEMKAKLVETPKNASAAKKDAPSLASAKKPGTTNGSNKPGSSSSKKPFPSSSSSKSVFPFGAKPKLRPPPPRNRGPLHLGNDDRFSFHPADPDAKIYNRHDLAAMFSREKQVIDLEAGTHEWNESQKELVAAVAEQPPALSSLIPPLVKSTLVHEETESVESYRDRIIFEGFVPYTHGKWFTPAQLHHTIASVFTDLKPKWTTLKKQELPGTEGGFDEWIHRAITPFFEMPKTPAVPVPVSPPASSSPEPSPVAATAAAPTAPSAATTTVATGVITTPAEPAPPAPIETLPSPVAATPDPAVLSQKPSVYVRAQMMMQQMKITRRHQAQEVMTIVYPDVEKQSASKEDSELVRYRFSRDTSIIHPTLIKTAGSKRDLTSASGASTPTSSLAKRRKIGDGVDEHKSAVRHPDDMVDEDGQPISWGDAHENGEQDDDEDMEGTIRLPPHNPWKAEAQEQRRINAQLRTTIAALTDCGTCNKRKRGTCIFPCGHSVWCEKCTLRNLGLDRTQPLVDGEVRQIEKVDGALTYFCPIASCSQKILAFVRFKLPPIEGMTNDTNKEESK